MIVADWPTVNTRAWVRLPCCGAEHPTRVEDFVEDDCVIGAPMAPHPAPVLPSEVEGGFFLGWVFERGALEVPVELVEHALEPIPIWQVRAIGQPIETQRRNYVRFEVALDARLHLLEGGATTDVKTMDVSEGGLRARVDRWAIDPGPRAFDVELDIEGETLELRAQTAWWGPLDEQGEHRVVGVKFIDVAPTTADEIRGWIFKAQIAERRRRLG